MLVLPTLPEPMRRRGGKIQKPLARPVKRLYVYLAGPYSYPDVAWNVNEAMRMSEVLLEEGFIPFTPHLYHMWHLIQPHSYDFWIKLSSRWITKCDAVLRVQGISSGADKEVEYAVEKKVPVFYSLRELVEWRDKLNE